MNKSNKVRAVYAELRRTLPPSYSARRILEIAYLFVEQATDEREDRSFRTGSMDFRGFSRRPIDVAIADGGWQVLEFESRRGMQFGDDDAIEAALKKTRRYYG
jgi:hypothetical protein